MWCNSNGQVGKEGVRQKINFLLQVRNIWYVMTHFIWTLNLQKNDAQKNI
jgi:hypothetical protein